MALPLLSPPLPCYGRLSNILGEASGTPTVVSSSLPCYGRLSNILGEASGTPTVVSSTKTLRPPIKEGNGYVKYHMATTTGVTSTVGLTFLLGLNNRKDDLLYVQKAVASVPLFPRIQGIDQMSEFF